MRFDVEKYLVQTKDIILINKTVDLRNLFEGPCYNFPLDSFMKIEFPE